MKIVLNCMVRNEKHHVPNAMAHFTSLFDEINVVDHCSTDGTAGDILCWRKSGCAINVFEFGNAGYYQSEVMTFLARHQMKKGDADWVFFLDFDEYLPFKSRAELEQALVPYQSQAVIKMLWHNLVPLDYTTSTHLGRSYLVGPNASVYGKIAFQPRLLRPHPEMIVEQGNHAIAKHRGGDHLFAQTAFGLFHVPIDTPAQLRQKIETGVKAYYNHAAADKSVLGRHWVLMRDALVTGENEVPLLNGMIARYGENQHLEKVATLRQSYDALRLKNFRKITLDVAGSGVKAPDRKSVSHGVGQDCTLTIGTDMLVSADPPFGQQTAPESYKSATDFTIKALPAHNPLLEGTNPPTDLNSFIPASLHKIETLTATAWGGHIPFMFALIETLRPRRYVELGTHCGASFFAACQRLRDLDLPSLAVAIDLWEGDPQAGFYGKEVYDNFEYLRTTRYPNHSRSIKSYFIDAARHFEDGSVDLIHIDGLHTYEAVAEDYRIWRPKLTQNGVIIFHDTNEYQATFGVWDFFAKTRHDATASFEFKHTHGLGIMAFGDSRKNPMIDVLRSMAENRVRAEQHFARQGELAVKEALLALKESAPAAAQTDRVDHVITDGTGITTKTLARLLATRIRNKALVLANSRVSSLLGRA